MSEISSETVQQINVVVEPDREKEIKDQVNANYLAILAKNNGLRRLPESILNLNIKSIGQMAQLMVYSAHQDLINEVGTKITEGQADEIDMKNAESRFKEVQRVLGLGCLFGGWPDAIKQAEAILDSVAK